MFSSCYDGFPSSNANQRLFNVHQIQCAIAPKQVKYELQIYLLNLLNYLFFFHFIFIGIPRNNSSFRDSAIPYDFINSDNWLHEFQ